MAKERNNIEVAALHLNAAKRVTRGLLRKPELYSDRAHWIDYIRDSLMKARSARISAGIYRPNDFRKVVLP